MTATASSPSGTRCLARGFFGIGVWHPKTEANIGTLWRSAHAFGADFIYTVGRRYPMRRKHQASDTTHAPKSVPLYHYADLDDLIAHLPYNCPLVGVELAAKSRALSAFHHPERACYMLGAEDYGLSEKVAARCHMLVQIPGATWCLNVATAGSIVIYDRVTKAAERADVRSAA